MTWIFQILIGVYLHEFAYWVAIYFNFLIPYINLIYFKLFCAHRQAKVDSSYNAFSFDAFLRVDASESAVSL